MHRTPDSAHRVRPDENDQGEIGIHAVSGMGVALPALWIKRGNHVSEPGISEDFLFVWLWMSDLHV